MFRIEDYSKNKKSRGLFGLPTALGIAKKWLSIHGQTSPKKEKIKAQPGLIVDHLYPSSLLSQLILTFLNIFDAFVKKKFAHSKHLHQLQPSWPVS
jgi:metallophosphoesterase superfamily enzyme